MLVWLGDNAREVGRTYGNIAPASLGAIQRALLVLENQGAAGFLGEPALELRDLIAVDERHGTGQRADVGAADAGAAALRDVPALAALGAVRAAARGRRPGQAGAGLLLRRGAPALLRRAEGAGRQGRPGGAADPLEGRRASISAPRTPTTCPATCSPSSATASSTRCAPSRRATPRRCRQAAETFRPNPDFDTETAIREVGTGEAVVSLLEAKGVPAMVSRTLIRPPESRMGPVTAAERAETIAASPLAGRYDAAADRESAHEILSGRAEAAAREAAMAEEMLGQAAGQEREPKSGAPLRADPIGARRSRRSAPSSPAPSSSSSAPARARRWCAASSAACSRAAEPGFRGARRGSWR